MKTKLLALAAGLTVFAGAQAASASSVLATYYKATGTGPTGDFENLCCSTSIEVASHLGANGLPVWVSGEAVQELNTTTNEIAWWTPDGSHITQDGAPVIVTLPILDDSVFTPQGTGSGNGGANGFQTIHFQGSFATGPGSTPLSFSATSDDDFFLFIDGAYVDSPLDGIHAPEGATFGTNVAAGPHTFDLFYADRHTNQAVLHFGVVGANLTSIIPTVPEPASWALMILGFGGVGVAMRRRRMVLA